MDIIKYTVCEKEATLYLSGQENSPLIVLHTYTGDGKDVIEALDGLGAAGFSLLCISGLNWNHDMTPWSCPPLFPKDIPCTGGADDYLRLLTTQILPAALRAVKGKPSRLGIAGYSLAGLFSVYTLYRTDIFDRAASMSGSFWFPDFRKYAVEQPMKRVPEKVYFSLGDTEDRSRNPVLRTVRENTEAIADHCRALGAETKWELNPGSHFRDADLRSAKGILSILSGERTE